MIFPRPYAYPKSSCRNVLRLAAGEFAFVLLISLLLSSFSGCAYLHRNGQINRLYFGLSSPAGEISEAQFKNFLDTEISKRFPDGLTVYSAYGQWKNEQGKIVQEQAKVVEIVGLEGKADRQKIDELRSLYKKKFDQDSVLSISHGSSVSF